MLTDAQRAEIAQIENRLDHTLPVLPYERGRLVALSHGATGDDLRRLNHALDRLPRREPTVRERPAAHERGVERARTWRPGGTSFA